MVEALHDANALGSGPARRLGLLPSGRHLGRSSQRIKALSVSLGVAQVLLRANWASTGQALGKLALLPSTPRDQAALPVAVSAPVRLRSEQGQAMVDALMHGLGSG